MIAALLEHLTLHAIERLAARPWLPRILGPLRLGRCVAHLAPTADTADTMGATP